MSMVVSNTRPDAPRATLFGRLDDGSYVAEVMDETGVPYTPYWKNAIDQVMVYIDPDKSQLKSIIAALNDGRLELLTLQKYGASNGGTSTIPI